MNHRTTIAAMIGALIVASFVLGAVWLGQDGPEDERLRIYVSDSET